MLIDINLAKKFFSEYVKKYDYKDKQVKLKISHIERVSQMAKKLAIELSLSEEDIKLAELIGLLHDIGRFEQIKNYHTFIDSKSINHAEYGVKVLFEDGLIRSFIESDEYDNLIRKAILNHNRLKIEDGLSDKELLHAKLIRDADKLDIFYNLTFEDKSAVWGKDDISNEIISDEIYREYIENRAINYSHMNTGADLLVANFAYVYNLYFKQSLIFLKNKNYLEKIYKRFDFKDRITKERYENVYKQVKTYIDKKSC